MKLKLIVFAILLSGIFYSCKEELQEQETEQGIVLEPADFSKSFEANYEKDIPYLCRDDLSYLDTIKTFYARRNFKPLWWDAMLGDSASWADLNFIFHYSHLHGMDHRYYNLPLVDYHKQKILDASTEDSAYQIMGDLELIITNGLVRMYNDIANGRTSPKKVYGYTYMLPRNNVKDVDWESFLTSSTKSDIIDKIHVNDTAYNKLLGIMRFYLEKSAEAKSQAIDFSPYPKIEVGDTIPILPAVIQRLKARNLPDSGIHQIPDSTIYTKQLAAQIKKLQKNYSLTPDGIMGFKTYKVINNSPTDKIDKIKANLERQRWFSKPKVGKFVYINLPEYRAYLHWADSVKSMKVCIGKNLPDNYDAMVKTYTDSGWLYKLPKNMETPQIASRITYMVVNPTWTIPYSIIRREMWWRLVKDPAYLSRTGHKVYRGKTEVNGDTIQWSKINKNRIPYQIVQNPGRKNALGTVKYMFNNPFSIYLHDTPSKSAFNRTQRAVSHGCVRLEHPILFGEFLMENVNKYDSDDFRILMGYPPKDKIRLKEYDPQDTLATIQPLEETTKIHLNKSVPLYLDYRTVYFEKDWTRHYSYDIYDQNKLILEEMYKM